MKTYHELTASVLHGLDQALSQVDAHEVNQLAGALIDANKVFIFGIGRVFLTLQCLGKRLAHLGLDCQIVGAVTEKPIAPGDLMLIASGSGESKLPAEIARMAKAKGAKLALITASRDSTIKALSDVVVHIPCPTKKDLSSGVKSSQSMTNLFDESLHIFGDVLSMLIQQIKGLTEEFLWQVHANLE